MQDYYAIQAVMEKCTARICSDVNFKYLKPRIVDIFAAQTLERAEGRDRANCDIMMNLCGDVKTLSKQDFQKFMEAISVDYEHVAVKMQEIWKQQLHKSAQSQRGRHGNSFSTPARPLHMPKSKGPQRNLPSGTRRYDGASQRWQSLGATSGIEEMQAVECQYDLRSQDTLMEVTPSPHPGNYRNSASQVSSSCHSAYQKARNRNHNDVYKMESNPRGLAIIISNEIFERRDQRRGGTEADVEKLRHMFIYLSFEVILKKNLKAEEMKTQLKDLSKSAHLRDKDALAVAILTHGGERDTIYGTDWNIVWKTEIQNIFGTRECRFMKGKPKIFIIQACRGVDEHDEHAEAHDGPHSSDAIDIHVEGMSYDDEEADDMETDGRARADTADICFVHSSSPGFKSYRRSRTGSPFLTKLTEVVQHYAHEEEVTILIRRVIRHFSEESVGRKFTMPTCETILPLQWYLNPPARN